VLERGCVGVSLPAGAFGPALASDSLNPVLARIERREVPLFIHPGPGLGSRPGECSLADPLWWPALTRYVAQMQEAWLALSAIARREHPGLQILYAMLAGGAPLLSERLAVRGGPDLNVDSRLDYYDTSSYGPAAVSAMAQRVGLSRLVHGSDRPVAEPLVTGFDTELRENGAWLVRAQVPA
jgi:predicted TIM-barrel fold metal-dependent hydrolase